MANSSSDITIWSCLYWRCGVAKLNKEDTEYIDIAKTSEGKNVLLEPQQANTSQVDKIKDPKTEYGFLWHIYYLEYAESNAKFEPTL